MNEINITTLKNGLRVCSDRVATIDSVSVFLMINIGSRNETIEVNGISHFLEHMLFKGTKKRTALQIAEEIEDVGGYMNAFTSREKTAYYIKAMSEDIELCFDILSDTLINSIFDKVELEKERGVILQEFAASLDTPEDVASDYFSEIAFPNQSLGRRILGTKDTINGITSDDLFAYVKNKYSPKNITLSVCGNVDHNKILSLAEKYFGSLSGSSDNKNENSTYKGGFKLETKDNLEQVQFLMGFNTFSYHDDKYYIHQILSNILGGGMSSRLFQEVREKRGLVYSVSSFSEMYSDNGIFGIYAGTSANKVNELIDVVCNELKKFCTSLTHRELQRTVKQYKASLAMSSENSTKRATKLASDVLTFNRYISRDEILDKVSSVKIEDIENLMSEILFNTKTNKPSIVTYGNISENFLSYEDICSKLL